MWLGVIDRSAYIDVADVCLLDVAQGTDGPTPLHRGDQSKSLLCCGLLSIAETWTRVYSSPLCQYVCVWRFLVKQHIVILDS